MGSQLEAQLCPSVEVALRGHSSAAGSLVDSVADVLREGGGADNGRLVDLGVLPDVVAGAIASHRADLSALSGAGAVAGVLLDVVLNERILSPAIDGDKNGAGSCTG